MVRMRGLEPPRLAALFLKLACLHSTTSAELFATEVF